jgi:pimeloyl-ACP methyl ester carboxylesterase
MELELDGSRIAFDRRGSGSSLVLVHGILQDHRAWRHQIDTLADEFDVVAWDAPGCGRSDDPPPTFRMPEYADRLAALITALGLERPHVVGLSLGGALALELYRRHPEIPRSLVLVAAYAGWAGSLPPEVGAERLARAVEEADRSPETFIPGWIPGLLTEATPAAEAEEVVAMMIGSYHRAGYLAMAHALAEADLRDALPRIEVPTLLLYGEADRRCPLSVGEALRDGIRGSRLEVLPRVGHLVNIEAPERFDAEVRGFFRRVGA